jgi:plastocyanin
MALLLGVALASARQDPATASAPRVIEVTARRFAFDPSRVEVEQGERIRLVVRSSDGVHGVAIRKFRVKRLVPRGGAPCRLISSRARREHSRYCAPRSAGTGTTR